MVEEFLTGFLNFLRFLFGGFTVCGITEFVHHQSDARNGGEQHLPLSKIAFEQFILNVGVDGQTGWFRDRRHTAR